MISLECSRDGGRLCAPVAAWPYLLFWVLFMAFASKAVLATTISEVEPNNSLAGAQSIDGFFSLDSNLDIVDSTTVPHASIEGAGETQTAQPDTYTYDYFKFTVTTANSRAVFDVDYAYPSTDSTIALWDSSGAPLVEADNVWGDCTVDPGGSVCYHPAGQQERLLDPFLEYTFSTPGVYFVGIAESAALSDPVDGGWYYNNPFLGDIANPLDPTDTYTLHVSLENGIIPEPSTALLLAAGLSGLAAVGRRRRS